jgi:CheY-like chemotaxis protein
LQPPYLFLVDIRMPRLDGIGFIHAVRADPELATTVIIVLTTSDSDRDRVAAQHAQVAGYLLKSHTDDELLPLAKMLRYHLLIMPEN